MFGLFCFLLAVLASPFKSKSRLEAENAALRHQLVVLRHKMRGRVRLTNSDRWANALPCATHGHVFDVGSAAHQRPAMKREVLAITGAICLLVSAVAAQTPSQDKELIPRRSIRLTAEDNHIIKEVVLKDMRVAQVPRNNDIKIGDRVPDEVQLQNFPALIAEKVPQVKTYKFFVTQNKIVVVSPQDKVVADLIQ